MEFSSQDYWSELFTLFQGIFPTQGSNPHLLHLPRGQVGSFLLAPLFAICLSPKLSWVTVNSHSDRRDPMERRLEVGEDGIVSLLPCGPFTWCDLPLTVLAATLLCGLFGLSQDVHFSP